MYHRQICRFQLLDSCAISSWSCTSGKDCLCLLLATQALKSRLYFKQNDQICLDQTLYLTIFLWNCFKRILNRGWLWRFTLHFLQFHGMKVRATKLWTQMFSLQEIAPPVSQKAHLTFHHHNPLPSSPHPPITHTLKMKHLLHNLELRCCRPG